jgi:HD superfamily phosphodiesterase
VRDTESDLLFHHSTRVYYFGALVGLRQKLKVDSELLYIGAMFHDIGLTKEYSSATERFEVGSANAARDFLRQYGKWSQRVSRSLRKDFRKIKSVTLTKRASARFIQITSKGLSQTRRRGNSFKLNRPAISLEIFSAAPRRL